MASADAPGLNDDLVACGIDVLGDTEPALLVRDAARLAPDVLVCWDAYPATGLLSSLAALREHAPLPVLLFTSDADADTLAEALRSGVDAYVVDGYARQRLRSLLRLAQERFARDAAQHKAHAELAHRFEERKLIDRAKGILMRAQQIPEEEAFRRLRDASMQGHQRVGLVSRRVIDAARDAEAVNRAGQLRMLSQHIVKLAALQAAGDSLDLAGDTWDASVRRVEINLEQLGRELSKATFGDLLARAEGAWQALQRSARPATQPGGLAAVDADAERLLEAADRLTAALEAASPLATLDIVNRSGRQRMLSQRLAKQALLANLLEGPAGQAAAAGAVRTIEAFEAALKHLTQAPLSSASIQADLSLAQQQWLEMLAGVRAAASPAGRQAIALASEALLETFDRLTRHYEQAVQQLLAPKHRE